MTEDSNPVFFEADSSASDNSAIRKSLQGAPGLSGKSVAIGSVLADRYRIVSLIGAGGMGEVYLAEDRQLGRKVALKTLRIEVAGDPELLSRFRAEARAIAALNHPNVVTIYSVEDAQGMAFLTMEYIPGEPLSARIPAPGLPADRCLALATDLAGAVAAVHAQGIVHRDLKPANVILTSEDQVKVLDFGLAKVFVSASGSAVDTDVTTEFHTRTGVTLGTLPYMSPEQVQARPLDARSDVFSLGIIFYEVAAGTRPFCGASSAELTSSILRDEARPLARIRPDLAPAFQRVVRRCLQKIPEDRYAHAGEVLADLQREAEEPAAATRPRASQATSIAVLDFENITGDPDVDWLGTGIAETVTADLRKIPGISVTPREQVVQAQIQHAGIDTTAAVLSLGLELDCSLLIKGAFQNLSGRVRITGQVLEPATGAVRGSVKLDGNMEDIFDLQDRVLASLLDSAQLKFTASDRKRIARPETVALQAYEFYTKAQQKMRYMGVKAFQEAEELLIEALNLDPDYAMVHATLGQMHALRYIATTDPRDLDEALEHLGRAVTLDPELGEPHAWLSYCHSRQERHEQAIAVAERAMELDHSNPIAHYFCAVAHWLRGAANYRPGDWEAAARHSQRATELMPTFQPAFMVRADNLIRLGRLEEARIPLEQAVALERADKSERARFVGSITQMGLLDLEEGDLDSAERWLAESLAQLETSEHVMALQYCSLTLTGMGHVAAARGDLKEAAELCRAAVTRGERHQRRLGMGRVLALAGFSLAGALQTLGLRTQAAAAAQRAEAHLAQRARFDYSGLLGAMDVDILQRQALWLEIAGRKKEAQAAWDRARKSGLIQST